MFRVRTHRRRSHFVDNGTPGRDGLLAVQLRLAQYFSAHRFDNPGKCLLHMGGLFLLMRGPFEMKPENRDAPGILLVRIDLTITMLIGNHLAASGKPDEGAIVSPRLFL